MTCAASKWQTEDLFTDSSVMKGIDHFPGPVGAPAGGLLATPWAGPRLFPCARPSLAHLGAGPRAPMTQPWGRAQEAPTHRDHRQASG